LDRQDSTDSTQLDNPFREEGTLSKFATDIVDAVKSGRLSEIQPKTEVQNNNNHQTEKPQQTSQAEPEPEAEHVKTARDKESDEVEVSRGLVVPGKVSQTETVVISEDKLRRKCSCCVLL